MKRRHFSMFLATATLVGLSGACLAPTLPLPPPEEPDHIRPAAADGTWEIGGNCTTGAIVIIKNERTGMIVGFDDEQRAGRYLVELQAEECDLATVLEVVDDDATSGASFLVREVIAGVAQTDCDGSPP